MIFYSHPHEGLIIGFLSLNYAVRERDSDTALKMKLFKTLESEQTYNVRLIGIPSSAKDDDFSVPAEVFVFPPESETLTVFVNITGDRRIELTEQFAVRLLSSGGPPFQFELATISATISIVENDRGKINTLFMPVVIKKYSMISCFYNYSAFPVSIMYNCTDSIIPGLCVPWIVYIVHLYIA